MPPWKESMEAVLTILPPCPCATICLATAWDRKKTVLSLTWITSSQSFSPNSRKGARRMMPALLSRISMPPSSRTTWSTTCWPLARSSKSAWTWQTRRPRDRTLAAGAAEGAGVGGGFIGAEDAHQRQIGAGFGEPQGSALAETTAGTGNHGDFSVELKFVEYHRQESLSNGTESISVNSWFSPPMPQQKA